MNRTDIINRIIKSNGAKKYLEIGVDDGVNFSKINCDYKIGVDPASNSPANIHSNSDEFFDKNKENFDVVFIDGLHHADQVYKDIINSLKVLNKNGYIVCHDMNPIEEIHQIIPYSGCGAWTGDCWKAFVKLRMGKNDLEMYTVDTDYGCGIITKGHQKLLKVNDSLTYNYLDKNRKELLNLISPEKFLSKFVYDEKHDLASLLHRYIYDSENADNNFSLAIIYENMGQTAAALSYYLRAAERSESKLLQYECLIRSSICFEKQGTRNFTAKGLLLHSLAILPKRPEAYYLLSKFYEKENKDGSWQESYTMASVGCDVSSLIAHEPLRTFVGYNYYGLLFQKALSSWWCGLCQESKEIFKDLINNYNLDNQTKQAVTNNMKFLKLDVK